MTTRILAIALAAFVSNSAVAQRNFDDVTIKITHVAGNVHMLEGRGGNIGVSAGPDGILIVDDQFAPLAEKIRKALDKIGGEHGKLKFVLNTHHHPDHTGANPVFGREAVIIAHKNVRERLINPQTRGDRTSPAMASEGWPVITFDDSLTIHFNGEKIRIIHLPNGHTDGDSVIVFTESNVVHMGDDFFAGRFPFVDLDSGGSVQGLTRNIAKVIKQVSPDVKIIPGHGPLSTVDDLKAFHDMLIETTRIVKDAVKNGRSLDQLKADGLPSKWDGWGSGFIPTERWIETIHKSLSRPIGSATP